MSDGITVYVANPELSAGQKIGIVVSFLLFVVIVYIIASFAKRR